MWLSRHEAEIFASGVQWQAAGDPVALALIVGVEGSAYRKPGARLLVGKNGSFIGLVSGGCLEQDIVDAASRVQQSGGAEVLEFDTRPEDDTLWGWGSGCRGLIHVLVHRPDPNVLRVLHDELDAGRAALMATVVSSSDQFAPLGTQVLVLEDGTVVGDDTLQQYLHPFEAEWPSTRETVAIDAPDAIRIVSGYAHGASQATVGAVLVEPVRPTPRLLVIGAGDDVPPVVDVATAAGLRTTVIDHRPSFANRLRFPTADEVLVMRPEDLTDDMLRSHKAAVLMTHQFEWDRVWLERISSAPFAYLGVLGPPDRTRRLLEPSDESAASEQNGQAAVERTERADDTNASSVGNASTGHASTRNGSTSKVSDLLRQRQLYGPVGLDIGGEGPGPIAVSMIAEVLAVLHGRGGGHLRDNYERNKRRENEASRQNEASVKTEAHVV